MPQDPDRFQETTPDPVLTEGTLSIVYVNSGKANETVTISVGNGEDPSTDHEVELDEHGRGELDFTVPAGWEGVTLNGPQSGEHVVPVLPPVDP